MNLEDRLSVIVKQFGSLKAQVSKEHGQLAAYQEQLSALAAKCNNLGIKPEELSAVIVQKELDLENVIQRTETKLTDLEAKRSSISANINVNRKS